MRSKAVIAFAIAFSTAAFPQPVADYTGLAWNTLKTGLQDGDVAHRKQAIAAAGTLGGAPAAVQSEAVRLVADKLHDKDLFVRQSAADALGEIGSREAIPALRAALDDSPEVSFAAAKALWKTGDQTTAREIFVQILVGERKDTPTKMQSMLRDAKHRLRPEQLALLGAKEAAGPAGAGVEAVEEILKQKGGGGAGRAAVVGPLSEDEDPYTLEMLEWALGDSSGEVRLAVVKALGTRGNARSVLKLVPLMSDDRHAVRYMAAASFLRLSPTPPQTAAKP